MSFASETSCEDVHSGLSQAIATLCGMWIACGTSALIAPVGRKLSTCAVGARKKLRRLSTVGRFLEGHSQRVAFPFRDINHSQGSKCPWDLGEIENQQIGRRTSARGLRSQPSSPNKSFRATMQQVSPANSKKGQSKTVATSTTLIKGSRVQHGFTRLLLTDN